MPATNLQIKRLPTSNGEAQSKLDRARQYNLKEGLDAQYDVFGDDGKWEKLNDPAYTSACRIKLLFEKLKKAQMKGKDDAESTEESD